MDFILTPAHPEYQRARLPWDEKDVAWLSNWGAKWVLDPQGRMADLRLSGLRL